MRWLAWLGLVACGTSDGGGRVDDILSLDGDVSRGLEVYDAECALCHGDEGQGGVGASFVGEVSRGESAEYVNVILAGEDVMVGYADILSDQEIADVLEYILSTFGG